MDREQLADFLRHRREALQPEDVGLARGARRRTNGLRREEVALLASMSTDYYTRLEQQRGPQPSEPMLAAIARALRLTSAERDHLYRLAGHTPPARTCRSDHVSPAMLRVLDRLDTPAQVMTDLAETLVQNPMAVALLGDESRFALGSLERSRFYRWFTDPQERAIHADDEHDRISRSYASALRVAMGRHPDDARGVRLAGPCSASPPSSPRSGPSTTSPTARAPSPRPTCTRRSAAWSSSARSSPTSPSPRCSSSTRRRPARSPPSA